MLLIDTNANIRLYRSQDSSLNVKKCNSVVPLERGSVDYLPMLDSSERMA